MLLRPQGGLLKSIAFAFIFLCFVSSTFLAQAKQESTRTANGLSLKPPMGWNSWNKFACNITEEKIRGAADQLASNGLKAAGYEYVVIDDCWQGDRDSEGRIRADREKFPSGIKALVEYVHSRGLKFGIYSDAGNKTCGGRAGSRGHEFQDALQYAAWGVDYLKYDWCNVGTQDAQASYLTMSDALRATGRPIVFSMCEWGTAKPWLWAASVGNLWRTTGDIWDHWQGHKTYSLGMMDIVDLQVGLASFSGPGHWNDPDMLEVGNGGMTIEEYRSHFSLWAELAAPLMAGNDLSTMSSSTKEILTNSEVIAIDQDVLGKQGDRIRKDGDLEVWSRPLADGGRAVVLLNRSEGTKSMKVTWEELGYPRALALHVRDLWMHKDLSSRAVQFEAPVASHGVVMIRLGL
jgi:alpha-galactosidase